MLALPELDHIVCAEKYALKHMDVLLGTEPVKCMEIRQIGWCWMYIVHTPSHILHTYSGSSAFCNIWKNKYFIHVSSYQSPGSVERRVLSSIFLPLSSNSLLPLGSHPLLHINMLSTYRSGWIGKN